MPIFKRGVGRPSNLSIKRRRILIVTLILAVVLLGGFGINKLIINKDITSNSYEAKADVNVKFDANGGKISGKNSVTYVRKYMGGYKAPTPTGPKNYKFEGWYTAKKGGTKVTNLTRISTNKAHTLYAHWGITYEVAFNKNGAKKISDTKKTCYKKNDESYCTVKAPNITAASGFEDLGWGVTSTATVVSVKENKNIQITRNTTFYAITKSKDKYLAVFEKNGASSISKKKLECYRYNGASACTIKTPSITPKKNFEVMGWGSSKNATTSLIKPAKEINLTKPTVTYYAITRAEFIAYINGSNVYSVGGIKNYNVDLKCYSYNGNDSCTITLPKGISTYTSDYDGKKCKSGGNECKGYTIDGWSCSDVQYRTLYREGAKVELKENEANKALNFKMACQVQFSRNYSVKFDKGTTDSIVYKSSKILEKRLNHTVWIDPDSFPYVYSKGNSISYTTAYKKNSDDIKSITYKKSTKVKDIKVYKSFRVLNMDFEVEKGISYNYYTKYKNKVEEIAKHMPWLFYPKSKVFLLTEKSYLKLAPKGSAGLFIGGEGIYAPCLIRAYNSYSDSVVNAVVHELGHAFDYYYSYKTGSKISEQSDIIELYNKYKNYKKDQPISPDGYSNTKEFVAGGISTYYVFQYKKLNMHYKPLTSELKKVFEKYINNAKAMYKGDIK